MPLTLIHSMFNYMKRFLNFNKNFIFFSLLLTLIVLIMGHNYIFSNQMPLTEDGHGNLGLAWVLKESILRYKWLTRWDAIGGTPLGEFHPFPGSFYYSGIIFLIFRNPALALKITIFLPIIVAGIAMYCFIFSFTGNPLGSQLAGLIYALNPYFLLEGPVTGHINLILVYMILPFLLLTFYQAIKNKSLLATLLAVGVYTLILLSDIQFAILSTLILFFFATYCWLISFFKKEEKRWGASARRIALTFIVIIFFAFLLSSYQVITWFEIKPEVVLQGFDLFGPKQYSSSLWEAFSLQTGDLQRKFHYSLNPFYAWYLFIALLGFLLGKKPDKYFFLGFYLFSIILAMGLRTPVLASAYRYLPFFSYFRVPFRFYFLTVVAICFLVGWIKAEKINKYLRRLGKTTIDNQVIGWALLGIIIFLSFGFLNGPLRWHFFQTFSLPKKNNYFHWIYQGSRNEWLFYQWLKNAQDQGGADFFPIGIGHSEISRLGTVFHDRRSFQAAQWHTVGWRLPKFIEQINRVDNPKRVAELAGILDIGYLLPRNTEAENFLAKSQSFQKIELTNGANIFKNQQLLPYLRIVEKAIFVVGEGANELSEMILKDENFDPQQALFVIGESQFLDDYEIDFLKQFDELFLAGEVFRDEQKGKELIDQYKTLGRIKTCETKTACNLDIVDSSKGNGLLLINSKPQRLIGKTYFEVEIKKNGGWLVLGEPYFPHWQARIGKRFFKPVPVYGALTGFFITSSDGKDPKKSEVVKGYIDYGRSFTQGKALSVSLFFLLLYLILFGYSLSGLVKRNYWHEKKK